MTIKEQIIPIKNCPLCTKSHDHVLDIEGGIVSYCLDGPADMSKFDKLFKVILTCPNKNETFRADIKLNTFGYHIEKVNEKK